jgi:ubiquinone/menaquinone biosynthesis C-methylase UbiE
MMEMINWLAPWQSMLLRTRRVEFCNVDYWDKQASRFNENVPHMSDLTQNQLSRLPLMPDYTVLDVGAGSGRVTIPVAKRVKQVTALEPSQNMLALLKANAEKESVTNIRCVHGSLKETENSARFDSHDVVMASFSLLMIDIEKALLKMDALADKGVYLFLSASKWMDDELQRIVYGELIPMRSDCIYVFNILRDLGIFADVELWNYTSKQSFSNIDAAVSRFMDLYHMPSEREGELREYLRRISVVDGGKFWLRHEMKVAMIWWMKTA